jgi:hypothetical protein
MNYGKRVRMRDIAEGSVSYVGTLSSWSLAVHGIRNRVLSSTWGAVVEHVMIAVNQDKRSGR